MNLFKNRQGGSLPTGRSFVLLPRSKLTHLLLSVFIILYALAYGSFQMFAVVLIIINYLKLINNLNIIAQKVSSCWHRRGLRFATAVFSVLSLSSFPSPKGSPILRVFFSVTINKYRTFSFNEFHAFLFSSFSLLCRFLPLFCSGGDRTASFPVFFF